LVPSDADPRVGVSECGTVDVCCLRGDDARKLIRWYRGERIGRPLEFVSRDRRCMDADERFARPGPAAPVSRVAHRRAAQGRQTHATDRPIVAGTLNLAVSFLRIEIPLVWQRPPSPPFGEDQTAGAHSRSAKISAYESKPRVRRANTLDPSIGWSMSQILNI